MTTIDARFRIDDERVAKLAAALAAVRPEEAWFVPSLPGATPTEEADFWCLVLAICQQTRTVRGVVDGEPVRGSDYLVMKARARWLEDRTSFTPASAARFDEETLLRFFSDDGTAAGSTLDRSAERVRLLHGVAALLARTSDHGTRGLLAAAGDRVAGEGGVLARLAACEAYEDPARKKSFLLLLFLERRGLFRPVDPASIGLPVDYHILRVLLRAGVVEVVDESLAARIAAEAEVSVAEDAALRAVAATVGPRMAGASGRDLFEVDNLLWMVGRNCCFYEHPPVCREGGPCAHRAGCSLVASTDYACADRCPLEGACRGSEDEAYAARRETRVDTHYY